MALTASQCLRGLASTIKLIRCKYTEIPCFFNQLIMNYSYITIRNQKCQNSLCTKYRSYNTGNIIVHSQKEKRLKCTACMKTWVIRKYTYLYRLKTDEEKIENAIQMFDEGQSIREIARNIQASPSTIMRWKKRLNL